MVLAVTFLIDHFDLFGLRQVWLYLIGRPYTALAFRTPGPYRLVRHPLYVGWLMVFWSAPVMTSAHLVFALATTIYILVAIQFEERDLTRSHAEYAEYRRQVPMLSSWRSAKTSGSTGSATAVQPGKRAKKFGVARSEAAGRARWAAIKLASSSPFSPEREASSRLKNLSHCQRRQRGTEMADDTLDLIKDLIETCKDGETGYVHAAGVATDPQLKAYFTNKAWKGHDLARNSALKQSGWVTNRKLPAACLLFCIGYGLKPRRQSAWAINQF